MHGSFAAAEHELANKSSEVVHLDRYCMPPQLNATALSQEAVVILYPARNFLPTTITLGQELFWALPICRDLRLIVPQPVNWFIVSYLFRSLIIMFIQLYTYKN